MSNKVRERFVGYRPKYLESFGRRECRESKAKVCAMARAVQQVREHLACYKPKYLECFGRREWGESKAFLTAKARAYIKYVSVSPLKITPLSPRSRRPKQKKATRFDPGGLKKSKPEEEEGVLTCNLAT